LKNACVFCNLTPGKIIAETAYVLAVRDIRPITPGHSLIIPKRHFESLFEATGTEWIEIMEVLRLVKEDLEREADPKGFNIAANINPVAGQVVMHAHLHLIPRYGVEEKLRVMKGVNPW
jgi:diadenosine tetraphosphate (Ap4A) HIT family hydrolase